MDISPVETCTLVWWVQISDFWFQLTLPVIYLEFKAYLISMATTAFCSDMPSHLVLRLVGLSFVFQQDNDPKHTSRLCKDYLTKESDGVLYQMTQPQPNWEGLGWVGPQSEGKAATKCSASMGTPSRHSSWSWFRECQECAKLSSWQTVATLKNLKYI